MIYNQVVNHYLINTVLTLYDPGGGFKSPTPFQLIVLTDLILELHYCALGTFPKKIVWKTVWEKPLESENISCFL